MATKKLIKSVAGDRRFSENCTQELTRITIRELKSLIRPDEEPAEAGTPYEEERSDQAARPISISPLNGLLHLHA